MLPQFYDIFVGPRAKGVSKPSARCLTLHACLLYLIVKYNIIPREGHRDEVSYLAAFIMDSILVGRRLLLSHIMIYHMILCIK